MQVREGQASFSVSGADERLRDPQNGGSALTTACNKGCAPHPAHSPSSTLVPSAAQLAHLRQEQTEFWGGARAARSLCLRLLISRPLPQREIFGCCQERLPPPLCPQQKRVVCLQPARGEALTYFHLSREQATGQGGFRYILQKGKEKDKTNNNNNKGVPPLTHLKKRAKQSPRRLLVVFTAPPVAVGFWQAWVSRATLCSLPSSPEVALASPHGACTPHLD